MLHDPLDCLTVCVHACALRTYIHTVWAGRVVNRDGRTPGPIMRLFARTNIGYAQKLSDVRPLFHPLHVCYCLQVQKWTLLDRDFSIPGGELGRCVCVCCESQALAY